MKKLLIIYPHWIPSNLVGVQRARLIANFLPRHGWHPIIVAVHPNYYTEPLVTELTKTVNADVEVHWCKARKKSRFLPVGDIALRGFSQLVGKAVNVIKDEAPDFIWSPLPSFYTSLVCRRVHEITGVPYGLDYMDPWVHDFPGARFPNKAWFAKRAAMLLEPIAAKKVSLLTGVTSLSYQPVIDRNPHLQGISTGYMPLGFDPSDYRLKPDNTRLLWDGDGDVIPIIYAGAFLPEAHYYIDVLFAVIAEMRRAGKLDQRLRLYFVGTGRGNLDPVSKYAERHGISDIVTEHAERISYLEVLHNLSQSFGVLAIGNRERHYTASKIFQTILSGQRVFPMFHCESTVVGILQESKADNFLVKYNPSIPEREFKNIVARYFAEFINPNNPWTPNLSALDKYSADCSAAKLVRLIEKALCDKKN